MDSARTDVGGIADRPRDIPRRGWQQVLVRTWIEINDDNISLIAAGVAFYGLLAIFPALSALVLIYGLVSDPAQVGEQLAVLRDIMPSEGYGILEHQTTAVASQGQGSLSVGLIISLLLAIWSAKKGVEALITALNIAYEEHERRGFIRRSLVQVAFTVAGIVFMLLALTAVAALPAIVGMLRASGLIGEATLLWTRWLLMAVMLAVVLALLYRYGPSRSQAKMSWINPGAIVASVLWIAGSVAFSWYVSEFATYNETFGSLGAVVILLMWLYLSAYVVCAGAELNAELERQTLKDTTTGPTKPLGQRGAYVADNKAVRAEEDDGRGSGLRPADRHGSG